MAVCVPADEPLRRGDCQSGMPVWHAESKKRRMARKLIGFNNCGETYAVLIEHAVRAGARDEARKLFRRAKITLPDEELPQVRQAAARIPKTQGARVEDEAAD